MSLFQITDNNLLELENTNFQKENLWERRDLQRWLKTNIEVLDSNILVIAEEFGEWDGSGRRIDLLAIDKAANLVVIELKRTDDGGHMDLQAIRYAAMITNMTWEQARETFRKYLDDNETVLDPENTLCEFLGWDEPREDEFAQNVRIILASGNFSKEVTTSVLWLNERDLDITCVRLSLYKLNHEVVLSADQIIPLPEAESYQIEVRQKRHEERVSRKDRKDRSLLSISFEGEIFRSGFKKSDIGVVTVNLLSEKELLTEEVFEFLRDDKSCGFQLLRRQDEFQANDKQRVKYRLKHEPELVYDGAGYYIPRNWGIGNINRFMDRITNKIPEINFSIIED